MAPRIFFAIFALMLAQPCWAMNTPWTARVPSLSTLSYDAAQGARINQDPLGENGGANLYGFVSNNPINFVDVLGMWPEVAGIDWGRKESWSAMGQGFGEGLSQSTAEFGNAAYYDLQLFNHAFYSTLGDVGGALSQTNAFLAVNGLDPNAWPATRGEVAIAKGLVIFGAWGKAACKISQFSSRIDDIVDVERRVNWINIRAINNGADASGIIGRRLERLGYDSTNANRILQSIQNGDQVAVVGENMRRVNAVANMLNDKCRNHSKACASY